jgi:hypothetical protein
MASTRCRLRSWRGWRAAGDKASGGLLIIDT